MHQCTIDRVCAWSEISYYNNQFGGDENHRESIVLHISAQYLVLVTSAQSPSSGKLEIAYFLLNLS